MSSNAPAASGLALTIRKAAESETFDLGGQNVSTIATTIHAAFRDPPLPLQEMIRITFVTGAGKLGRQKYDEGAAKAVTSTLRELGFEEDRGASCVLECAGTFKQQHDTGKNLKTVVVFPRVVGPASSDEGGGEGTTASSSANASPEEVLAESSPEHSIAFSSLSVFQRMLGSKCPTWSQKKKCIASLSFIEAKVQETEGKLMSGTPLTDPEQAFYDGVSATSLQEKQAYVKEQMQNQVQEGQITAPELKTLLQQVTERLSNLAVDKERAEKDHKPKLTANLANQTLKAEQRKEKLQGITPKPPPPLKHGAEINKLRKELEPLLKIDDSGKGGRLLSIKETQSLSKRDEILERIEQLETASRGWFEEDDAFEARLQMYMPKTKAPAPKKKPAASSTSSYVSPWSTTKGGKNKAGGKNKGGGANKSKSNATKPANVFAAMMMDSDSD